MEIQVNVSNKSDNYLQQFGSLIILDNTLHVIGVSENVLHCLKGKNKAEILETAFPVHFADLFGKQFSKIYDHIKNIRDLKYPRQIIPLKLKDKRIYLKLSIHHEQLFIEWEEQYKKYTSAKKINEFSFLLNTIQYNNWDVVCHAINRILHYDHVFVVQVHETGHSQVIAEDTLAGNPHYMHMEFSKSFMPEDIISYYSMCSYRYTPNLKDNKQQFYAKGPKENLLLSQLSPIPELHRLFLEQTGIVSALFFPIHIDGQLWGLLVAHHHQEKNIDLQQRKLCTFAIQNATSKYESYLKQMLLERNELLKDAEVELKIDLLKSKTVNCALVQHMKTIMEMANADGFAIFNQGDVCFHGTCPSKSQLYELIAFIQSHTEKSVFKDNNFRLNHGDKVTKKLPFAGLLYLKVGLLNDHVLLWFRNENSSKVTNLKVMPPTHPDQQTRHITISESVNLDTARPWNDIEISFVLRLNQILKESIVGKLKEKQQWSEQLLASNNELEMLTFTLSHDLKNPLSILKIGIQFLQNNTETLNASALQKWYSNLIASTESIEDIINNVVLLSQRKSSTLVKEPLPMAYTLQQIYKESTLLHPTVTANIHYEKTLPIWAEKSAIYQVFSNVIGNAIKYSTVLSGAKIKINSYFENDCVCYTIQDNGIGIPKENIKQIFEIFKRGDNVQDIEGTGVGLSLVKRIMERLGGSAKIESTLQQGTTVYLYFPMVEAFPPSMLQE